MTLQLSVNARNGMLDAIETEQLEGRLTEKSEALKFVREKF
jgi:hypothetical protein